MIKFELKVTELQSNADTKQEHCVLACGYDNLFDIIGTVGVTVDQNCRNYYLKNLIDNGIVKDRIGLKKIEVTMLSSDKYEVIKNSKIITVVTDIKAAFNIISDDINGDNIDYNYGKEFTKAIDDIDKNNQYHRKNGDDDYYILTMW